jgi:hypothetical protein
MVELFPAPFGTVYEAYRQLHIAANGSPEAKKRLGNTALLPRPWIPGTCLEPELRRDLWQWLEEVVIWLNSQYTGNTDAMIPACWAGHPHLVHEIAVLADQRRRAGLGLTSDALEEWHRYALPAFTQRMTGRVKECCANRHRPWPGQARHKEHTDAAHTAERAEVFARDAAAVPASREDPERQMVLRLVDRNTLVDEETGEILGPGAAGPGPRTRTTKGPRQ